MKTIKFNIFALVMAFVLGAFTACSPEDNSLVAPSVTADDLVEGIAFSIQKDTDNPNIVYLTSLMDSQYTPVWEHPQGRSQEARVTLNVAFPGEYSVKFGVQTRGGVVFGAPVTFTIDDFYAGFVTGEMWDMLAGGAGKSKTWVPDNGEYGMKQGFYSCFDPSATYLDMVRDEGKNNWYAKDKTWWEPSNGDIGVTADDLAGYMTFSLEGKAGLEVCTVTNGTPVVTTGLFSMNTTDHTMSAVDTDFLHGAWANGKAVDFRNGFQILVLTENQLMIANYRDEALSGEGRCIYCWNFVSKEYADSYVPPVAGMVYPTLEEGWLDLVQPKTNKVITYKLAEDTPFDWCNFDGSNKGISAVAPKAGIEDITLVLNSGDFSYSLTDVDGNSYEGTYSVTADGIYTFNGSFPEIALSDDGRAVLKANADNTLRVMSFDVDDYSGAVSSLWLGSEERDDQGNLIQYMAYQFIPQVAGKVKNYKASLQMFDTGWTFYTAPDIFVTGPGTYTATIEGAVANPYGMFLDVYKILKDFPNLDLVLKEIKADGVSVAFDDTVIDRGIGDEATTARRYILNPWGATAGDANNYIFSTSLSVTFEIVGDTGVAYPPVAE